MHNILSASLIAALATFATAFAETPVRVRLDANSPGRVFEGLGAVSAGGSTRLLYDYAEPYRSRILDLLFKPKFGAGFQHLKVEIGGGENATCGSEPSHAITRNELASPRDRGYEFWLMREARRRNPHIILDCLPWSFPGWLSGKFTQDSADWFVGFLDVARKQHGLELEWLSAAENENGTNLDWLVNVLRPTMDRRGYPRVKIQAPDDVHKHWEVFKEFQANPAYRDVVAAVGYHYVNGREPWSVDHEAPVQQATDLAKDAGKPLWASEEWSTGGGNWDPVGGLYIAQLINKLYVRDRITKVEFWAPIDSLYDGLPWHDTGFMRADSPWSGHFEVWPGLWAVAHTTQFVQPGWQYVDDACGRFNKEGWQGSYVTLRDPKTGDWSMIATTGAAAADISLSIGSGLKRGRLHVWKSDAGQQFVNQPPLQLSNGTALLQLQPKSIYTITTTTGQNKGALTSPPESAFPMPYAEDFESYKEGTTPRYFADQKGTFEVASIPGHGNCLRQVVPMAGYTWIFAPYVIKPNTVFGDHQWVDYSVSADVLIESGDVEIGGRFALSGKETSKKEAGQLAYRLQLDRNGTWSLSYRSDSLARGVLPSFSASQWHHLELSFSGARITARVDGNRVGQAVDTSAAAGMAVLASTYDGNLFDNVKVTR